MERLELMLSVVELAVIRAYEMRASGLEDKYIWEKSGILALAPARDVSPARSLAPHSVKKIQERYYLGPRSNWPTKGSANRKCLR